MRSANASGTKALKAFWFQLKSALSVITDHLHIIDRKIIEAQPNILLNQLFGLQELCDINILLWIYETQINPSFIQKYICRDTIMDLADSLHLDTATTWKIKWIEISSLCTHIHWLFNKRVRDIQVKHSVVLDLSSALICPNTFP